LLIIVPPYCGVNPLAETIVDCYTQSAFIGVVLLKLLGREKIS